MRIFIQGCGAVFLAVILIQTQGKSGKEFGSLIGIGVCAMCAYLALRYMEPVIDFLDQLEGLGGLSGPMVDVLLKITGIGILSEIAATVCSDTGNASLGKALQLLATGTILWLSLPLFTGLITLLQEILGEL